MIHNFSLLNQVDLFQYINILHHKKYCTISQETEYLFVNNRGIIYIMLGHIILTKTSLYQESKLIEIGELKYIKEFDIFFHRQRK